LTHDHAKGLAAGQSPSASLSGSPKSPKRSGGADAVGGAAAAGGGGCVVGRPGGSWVSSSSARGSALARITALEQQLQQAQQDRQQLEGTLQKLKGSVRREDGKATMGGRGSPRNEGSTGAGASPRGVVAAAAAAPTMKRPMTTAAAARQANKHGTM
jgi:TolA-binding protein